MQPHADGPAGYVPRFGSFGSGNGRASGGAFGVSGPAGASGSLPLNRSGSFHRRSASTSSGGRNGYVAPTVGLPASSSEAAAYQAAAGQQWHVGHGNLNWCAEPYVAPIQPPFAAAQQQYMAIQLGMQPGQFVPRSQSFGSRQQHRGRQLAPEAASEALAWHPQLAQHVRHNSGSWPVEGGSMGYQPVPLSASAPAPYMQHSGNGGGRSSSGRFGPPAGSRGAYGPSSAPPSAMQSPVVDRSRQQGPPPSAPPPPPLVLPVLDLQVGARQSPWVATGFPWVAVHVAACLHDGLPSGAVRHTCPRWQLVSMVNPHVNSSKPRLHACLLVQVPESAEDSPDLERFLQAATPQVAPPATGLQDLTLVSGLQPGAALHSGSIVH